MVNEVSRLSLCTIICSLHRAWQSSAPCARTEDREQMLQNMARQSPENQTQIVLVTIQPPPLPPPKAKANTEIDTKTKIIISKT